MRHLVTIYVKINSESCFSSESIDLDKDIVILRRDTLVFIFFLKNKFNIQVYNLINE